MSFMQSIRRGTKKHSTLILIIVILICIGLVISFAVFDQNQYSTSDGNSDRTTAESIEFYEQYIAEIEPEAGTEIDYATAQSLANAYLDLTSYYGQAMQEATDQATQDEYQQKIVAAATTALDYLAQQTAVAPENLNDYAKAELLGKQGLANDYLGNDEEARSLYEQGLALDPTVLSVALNYANFLALADGYQAGIDYANSYLERVEEGTNEYSQMSYVLMILQIYNEQQNLPADDTTDDADDGTEDGADGEAETDSQE